MLVHFIIVTFSRTHHQDHYVRLLVEKLAEKGLKYYWTWHITISVMTAIMKVLQSYLKHQLKRVKFGFRVDDRQITTPVELL